LNGKALYAFADETARAMGWELNFDLPGHRVSDFPHAQIYTGSLADLEATASAMRWILEIHVRDPQKRFGAFFEDMLLDDELSVTSDPRAGSARGLAPQLLYPVPPITITDS
jgi:methionyl aminopeptidase